MLKARRPFRPFNWSILMAVTTGLVGAALLHLVIVLALPYFSERDAYTRVLAEGERHRFYSLGPKPDQAGLAKDDPFLEVSACAFDLTDGPLRVTAPATDVPFWSLAVYDSGSNEIFSINDRTAADGLLDMVIATPVQLAILRKDLPEPIAASILVESGVAEGYVVLRSMAPQPSFSQMAKQFLTQATCAPFEWRNRNRF